MRAADVIFLSPSGAKKKLQELIEWLDEIDEDDFFGTEGWRHRLGWDEP